MQLTEHIYLVGGGPLTGFGLTSGPDAHVYMVDGGDSGLVLIDSGSGMDHSHQQIKANVAAHGFDPARLSTVAVTHYHADHAGGAPRLQEEFGTRIAVHEEAAEPLEAADESATSLAAARQVGVFPDDVRMRPCTVDLKMRDGDVIPVGNGELRMIATPGHARGHSAFLLEGLGPTALFTGDSVFWAGRILLQSVPDCDLGQSVASIKTMAELEFEAFLPGHGALALSGGEVHIAMAKEEIDSLGLPKGLL